MTTDVTGDVTTGADMARSLEVTGTPEPGTSTTPATATGPGGPGPAGSGAVGAAPVGPVGGPGRLPAGELRRRVAGFLVDHAGGQFTPGEVARGLGRSSGAVGNALTVLAGRGEAEQTCAKPVRYTATPASAAAAAVIRTAVARTGGPAPARTGVAGAASGSAGPVPARARTPRRSSGAGSGSPGRAGVSAPAGPGGGTEADVEVVSGPVARPNGQMYHPRRLSGLPDVTALRRLRAAGVPALLYGPPGTGKTSVVEAAFGDLVTVPGDGDTTVADLVGEYTQTPDGRYVFVHGPLVTAMREGRCLFIDDASLIPPTVLAVVYPAMDGRRQIIVKANGGEVITAAEGFYVVAGHNPGVHGAVLTDALSSRFSAQIHVSTDYDLARQLEIDRRAVRVARHLATRQDKGEVSWAPQLRELIAYMRIAEVLGHDAAAGNLVGIAPEEDRDTVAAVVRDVYGKTVTPLALGTRI